MRNFLKSIVGFIFIFVLSLGPVYFLSPWLSEHFYVWVDRLSTPHMEIVRDLTIESLLKDNEGEAINKLSKITGSKDDVYLKVMKDDKIVYEKQFGGHYSSGSGNGFCVEGKSGNVEMTYCRPAHRDPSSSFFSYLKNLFNFQVITQFKYTDYLLLHASIVGLLYSVFYSMRIRRKNILLKEIKESLINQ